MKNKDYYVYGLIDTRDNEIFYVGKGNGSRYKSHLSGKFQKGDTSGKYFLIRDILDSGFEVKSEILFPYLDEESSLELEKILIYKLGRKILLEGNLTNIVPGGKWKPGDSIFYEENFNVDFNLDKLDFVSKERFLSIKQKSTFPYRNIKTIYKYDYYGNLILESSLEGFFEKWELENEKFNILRLLLEEDLPIFGLNYVYTKTPLKNILFTISTIISSSSYTFKTQNSLLNMKTLLESLISFDSKEEEYFKDKLKEVENILGKGNPKY